MQYFNDLLDHKVGTPLYISSATGAKFAHSLGERGIAQNVSQFEALQIVPSNSAMTPKQIVEDSLPGQVFRWQSSPQDRQEK